MGYNQVYSLTERLQITGGGTTYRSFACCAFVLSVFPVVGVTVQVHYCKYKDAVCFDTVEHPIWKAVNETTSDLAFYFRPHYWILGGI